MLTPYQFASNTPISAIDLDGLEALLIINSRVLSNTLNRLKVIGAKNLVNNIVNVVGRRVNTPWYDTYENGFSANYDFLQNVRAIGGVSWENGGPVTAGYYRMDGGLNSSSSIPNKMAELWDQEKFQNEGLEVWGLRDIGKDKVEYYLIAKLAPVPENGPGNIFRGKVHFHFKLGITVIFLLLFLPGLF